MIEFKPCFECGEPAEYEHHVVPRSRGGTKTVPLCGKCHADAHHMGKAMNTCTLTREALSAKKTKGEKLGGKIPFGFDVIEGGLLVENPKEQATIAKISSLRAKGDSFQRIADTLNVEGSFTKTGKYWSPAGVFQIIKKWERDALRVAV